jgi:hypothetical protein
MKPHKTIVVAWLIALVAACGEESSSTPADAAPDAPPVTDAAPPPFVGDWLREPISPGGPSTTVSFRASGEYVYGAEVGTWSLDGDDLVTTRPSLGREAAPYYLSPDGETMLTTALFPVGPTDGLLGTWRGEFRLGTDPRRVNTFEFRSDGTMTWSDPMPWPGTWALTGNSLTVTVQRGSVVTVGLRVIPDVALGDGYLIRIH